MGENTITVKYVLDESTVEYPAWVTDLGEAIMEITGVDVMIAAMQAADLYSNPILAEGVALFVQGWIKMKDANWEKLSPNQILSLRTVINGFQDSVKNKFVEEGKKIPHIKELRNS